MIGNYTYSFSLSIEKSKKAGGSVNIRVLIGNADEMGDAGVSSAVMQMYLEHVSTLLPFNFPLIRKYKNEYNSFLNLY